jgi:iron complex transport system permease protein
MKVSLDLDALLATGIRALRRNRRWVLNTVAVFAGIHFCTQMFERLGASPGTVLLAGLLTLAVVLWLRMLAPGETPQPSGQGR